MEAPDVVAAMIEQAKSGDSGAGRALLATVCPPIRAIELPAALPPIPRDAGLSAQGMAVFDAMTRGLLSPSQGTSLIQAIGLLARLIETDDLMTRLEAAEQEIRVMQQQQPPAALPPPAVSGVGHGQQQPEPAEPPACTRVELTPGESLADVAEALGIAPDELQSQIDAGLIVITPAEETP